VQDEIKIAAECSMSQKKEEEADMLSNVKTEQKGEKKKSGMKFISAMANSNQNLISNWNDSAEVFQPNNGTKIITDWENDDENEDTNFASNSWGNTYTANANNNNDKPKIEKFGGERGGDRGDRPRSNVCYNCQTECGKFAKDCTLPKKERRDPRENRDNRDREPKVERENSNSWGNN